MPSTIHLDPEGAVSSMAVLRFVSAWKVLPPLSHLSASTSHARWPPPPALCAARPSTGPAWTKEIPCGHGQGQSVHLDTGIMEPRCCHRSGFGRRGTLASGSWFPIRLASKLNTVSSCPAPPAGRQAAWKEPSRGLLHGLGCPQPPPRANHAVPLPEISLTTDGCPLFPRRPRGPGALGLRPAAPS